MNEPQKFFLNNSSYSKWPMARLFAPSCMLHTNDRWQSCYRTTRGIKLPFVFFGIFIRNSFHAIYFQLNTCPSRDRIWNFIDGFLVNLPHKHSNVDHKSNLTPDSGRPGCLSYDPLTGLAKQLKASGTDNAGKQWLLHTSGE